MPKIFSSFCPVSMRSQKKKKGHRADGDICSSDFTLISKKIKKVLCLSLASFLRAWCDIPDRGAVNRSCLRFLAGNKNAGFWQEKKRQNLQNFSAKMPKKMSHFLQFIALIGNTAQEFKVFSCSEFKTTYKGCSIIFQQMPNTLVWII